MMGRMILLRVLCLTCYLVIASSTEQFSPNNQVSVIQSDKTSKSISSNLPDTTIPATSNIKAILRNRRSNSSPDYNKQFYINDDGSTAFNSAFRYNDQIMRNLLKTHSPSYARSQIFLNLLKPLDRRTTRYSNWDDHSVMHFGKRSVPENLPGESFQKDVVTDSLNDESSLLENISPESENIQIQETTPCAETNKLIKQSKNYERETDSDYLLTDLKNEKKSGDPWHNMMSFGKKSGDSWNTHNTMHFGKKDDPWHNKMSFGKKSEDSWDSHNTMHFGKRDEPWHNMMSFGKKSKDSWDNHNTMHFGKKDDPWHNIMSFGKKSQNYWGDHNTMHFGKRDEPWHNMMSFGKKSEDSWNDHNTMHFGKKDDPWHNMMSFGKKSEDSWYDYNGMPFMKKDDPWHNMMSFGKKSENAWDDHNTLHFGKREDPWHNMMSFGKKAEYSWDDHNTMHFGKREDPWHNMMSFGKKSDVWNNHNTMHFGKKSDPWHNMMSFGKKSENQVDDEADMPITKKEEVLRHSMMNFGKRSENPWGDQSMIHFGKKNGNPVFVKNSNLMNNQNPMFTDEGYSDESWVNKMNIGKKSENPWNDQNMLHFGKKADDPWHNMMSFGKKSANPWSDHSTMHFGKRNELGHENEFAKSNSTHPVETTEQSDNKFDVGKRSSSKWDNHNTLHFGKRKEEDPWHNMMSFGKKFSSFSINPSDLDAKTKENNIKTESNEGEEYMSSLNNLNKINKRSVDSSSDIDDTNVQNKNDPNNHVFRLKNEFNENNPNLLYDEKTPEQYISDLKLSTAGEQTYGLPFDKKSNPWDSHNTMHFGKKSNQWDSHNTMHFGKKSEPWDSHNTMHFGKKSESWESHNTMHFGKKSNPWNTHNTMHFGKKFDPMENHNTMSFEQNSKVVNPHNMENIIQQPGNKELANQKSAMLHNLQNNQESSSRPIELSLLTNTQNKVIEKRSTSTLTEKNALTSYPRINSESESSLFTNGKSINDAKSGHTAVKEEKLNIKNPTEAAGLLAKNKFGTEKEFKKHVQNFNNKKDTIEKERENKPSVQNISNKQSLRKLLSADQDIEISSKNHVNKRSISDISFDNKKYDDNGLSTTNQKSDILEERSSEESPTTVLHFGKRSADENAIPVDIQSIASYYEKKANPWETHNTLHFGKRFDSQDYHNTMHFGKKSTPWDVHNTMHFGKKFYPWENQNTMHFGKKIDPWQLHNTMHFGKRFDPWNTHNTMHFGKKSDTWDTHNTMHFGKKSVPWDTHNTMHFGKKSDPWSKTMHFGKRSDAWNTHNTMHFGKKSDPWDTHNTLHFGKKSDPWNTHNTLHFGKKSDPWDSHNTMHFGKKSNQWDTHSTLHFGKKFEKTWAPHGVMHFGKRNSDQSNDDLSLQLNDGSDESLEDDLQTLSNQNPLLENDQISTLGEYNIYYTYPKLFLDNPEFLDMKSKSDVLNGNNENLLLDPDENEENIFRKEFEKRYIELQPNSQDINNHLYLKGLNGKDVLSNIYELLQNVDASSSDDIAFINKEMVQDGNSDLLQSTSEDGTDIVLSPQILNKYGKMGNFLETEEQINRPEKRFLAPFQGPKSIVYPHAWLVSQIRRSSLPDKLYEPRVAEKKEDPLNSFMHFGRR